MSSLSVYLGIDVACAARKRLPICVVTATHRPMPLTIPPRLAATIPRGAGNKEISAERPFQEVARVVVDAINHILDEMGWRLERVAIDAPAAPPATSGRTSEIELGRLGLSSFRTPDASAWAGIRRKCLDHLRSGGSMASLPYANMIWMLYGFELYSCLRSDSRAEVIEVYPFAIVRALLRACEHKSTERGYKDQLDAVAAHTGWQSNCLETKLKATVPGKPDDRLDAFMAAWVASLSPERRRAYGNAESPNDAIWVPL